MRNKEREISRVIDFLSKRKGYYNNGKLKKGRVWLSYHLDIDIEIINEALNRLKIMNTKSNNLKCNKISDNFIPNSFKLNKEINITNPGTYWVTGCTHAPWQNQAMYDSTINFLINEIDLNGIILAGDFVDLNSLSFHDRGNIALPGVTLEYEYREANKLLNQFDLLQNKDNFKKIYLYGNHEDRYNRLLNSSDTSKYGEALKSPTEGLKLADRGYTVLTNWKSSHVNIGNYLEINHGEFYNVHTAKKTIDTYRKSVLYFHTHRFQIYMEGMVAGWNMGFGGDINAPIFNFATRAMKNSWVNSSVLVTLDNDGFYHVQPLLWINNKLIINGKQY